MHRVELKGKTKLTAGWLALAVPTAPCGVERIKARILSCLTSLFLMHRVELKVGSLAVWFASNLVPNAPCGVESDILNSLTLKYQMFLMHRVELKVCFHTCPGFQFPWVPNAPCGVESFQQLLARIVCPLFLMHRVELKGKCRSFLSPLHPCS